MCKLNFAVNVKRNMPGWIEDILVTYRWYRHIRLLFSLKQCQKYVDMEEMYDIIDFTIDDLSYLGAYDAKSIVFRSKTGNPARAGHAQSPSGRCQRFPVSGKRVFRSARYCTGQIRDAASSSNGRIGGCLCGSSLRLFPRYLLSGPKAVQRGRNRWTSSEATWAQKCSQAVRGSHCFCGNSYGGRFNASSSISCRTHQDSLRYLSTPTQYRARSFAAAKKTTQIAARALVPCCGELTKRYEQLRGQVLDGNQMPGSYGLGIFLHRGMASWIKAWGSIGPAAEKSTSGHLPQRQSCVAVRADIVMVLASMALSCAKEEGGYG